MTDLAWATLATPVGQVSVACGEAGVTRVGWGAPRERAASPAAAPAAGRSTAGGDAVAEQAAALAQRARDQLTEYFAGQRRTFEVLVDWATVLGRRPGEPSVRQRVLAALAGTVKYGETVTYGLLAARAEVPGDGQTPPARVVGQIMASNPYPLLVPCHRVVAGDGIGGFSGGAGIEVKRWLLTFEGSLPPTLDWDPAGPGQGLAGRG
ncbi:MAG TPA: methylated-DNA--[protein]-cysteine S-methyltransferase [Streptosporangiaceae bacterium]